MNILWITNIPSPYRVEFFNVLGLECNLTVLFERSSSAERDSSWSRYQFTNFKGIILKGIPYGVDKSFSPFVTRYLSNDYYDHIVVSNISSITGIFAIIYMKLFRIPYFVEGDGGIPKSGKGIKESIKRTLMINAKGYFSTGIMHDAYYKAYGANAERIFRYPFTSLFSSDVLSQPLDNNEKNNLRIRLGINEEVVVVAIGQFIYRKGFDTLLNACKDLEVRTGVYIVGGKPTKEYSEIINKYKITNVHFVDFMKKNELKDWLKAADIFILPTREDIWGLVINEAMSCGLPVITTSKCIAGCELIENGVNGYVIEPNDERLLQEKMSILVENELLRKKIGLSNLKKIKYYTYEEMSRQHIEVFQKCLR